MAALFDAFGRCISSTIEPAYVCRDQDESTAFLSMKCLDYSGRCLRFQRYLTPGLQLPTEHDFLSDIKEITLWLQSQPSLRSLLNGLCLPLAVPRLELREYGCYFESIFLGAVHNACHDRISRSGDRLSEGYQNFCPPLGLCISIHEQGRHERLVELMAKDALTALFFPWAFHGVVPGVCRKVVSELPQNMLVAGGIDTALAFVGYADILLAPFWTPKLHPSGIRLGDGEHLISFEVQSANLTVDASSYASCGGGERQSTGLLVLSPNHG